MKKTYFGLLLALGITVGACQQDEATVTTEKPTASKTQKSKLMRQANAWKTTPISKELVHNQQNISHYAFDVHALQTLIDNSTVTYVWFDLGINAKNQITFTATGEDVNDAIVEQVTSKIVSTKTYQANFSVFNTVKDISFGDKFNHILTNKDAYQYLTAMKSAYNNFEASLDQEGQRVERFGLDAMVVKRMLMTQNIHRLGLFLGQNKKQKMTTVFIGMDQGNNLLIDASTDISTAGKAFDFTSPCPSFCDSCTYCKQYCDSPWWMCCIGC
ncbi:MAG: hypothetical protein COA88_13620 [Kordia sp.]|nr:MAG: hypothetical protein COA88_13620 [Kordia sp.]